MEISDIVSKISVFGAMRSILASKYPMSIDTNTCNSVLTDNVKHLAQSAIGSGHDQFLTGIIVQFDLTFTNKAWVEAERYHFFDFVSSQSTMHRIMKFDLDKSYIDYVDKRCVAIMKELVAQYNDNPSTENYLTVLYTNPCGFRLTARMTTNYRQLKTIYAQRKNHRLPEWRFFCQWIETLPYADLITGGVQDDAENRA